jgi:adenosylcobinamide amidohydrolase
VRVVSIEPKQEKGRIEVKFIIGATSDEAKVKFLKALEESQTFTHIELGSVHRPSAGTSADQIVVELNAEYLRS